MRLVLIDFTMAISISNCEKNDGDWAFAEDISLYNCLDEELDRETYWEWLRTDRGELLEELAKRNHDELVRFYESRALLPAESLSCASGNAHDSADEGNSATPLAVDDLEEGQSSKRAAKPEPLLLVQKEFPPAGDTCLGDNSLKAISPGSGISPTSSTGSAKRTAELAFELRASSVPDDGSPKRPAIPSPKQSPRRLRSASRRSGSEGGSTKK